MEKMWNEENKWPSTYLKMQTVSSDVTGDVGVGERRKEDEIKMSDLW